ncbi:tumor protein p53-inducible nuclear protein 1-like [Arapaima gigas]
MFQRFASALFGDDAAATDGGPAGLGFDEKEEDEWILVDYLAETCGGHRSEDSAGTCPPDEILPAECPDRRSSSCSSLDSDLEALEAFLQLDACDLEGSWFITPPPCFTAGGRGPMVLETSPLENLLIEHPSMSVYATHARLLAHEKSPSCLFGQSLLRSEASLAADLPPDRAVAHSASADNLDQARQVRCGRHVQDGAERQRLSRSTLRRLNTPREGTGRLAKGSGLLASQPVQEQFNY